MILKVRNASFGYRPPEMILRDITFEAHPGELIAVLGPNGAGKTTLLRCILGSLKWTGGESTIDGLDIRRSDSRKLRQLCTPGPRIGERAQRGGYDPAGEDRPHGDLFRPDTGRP